MITLKFIGMSDSNGEMYLTEDEFKYLLDSEAISVNAKYVRHEITRRLADFYDKRTNSDSSKKGRSTCGN